MKINKHCKICNSDVPETFCGNCGQKIGVKKITVWRLIQDVISGLFSLESSVFGTYGALLVNPKTVVESYVQGNRRFYKSPGQILFYFTFILGIQLSFISPNVIGLVFSLESNALPPELIFIIIFLPYIAFASYLVFLRNRKGMLTHFISMVYLFSMWGSIFIVIDNILIYGLDINLETILFLIFVLVLFWFTSVVFTKNKRKSRVFINALILTITTIAVSISLLFILDFFQPDSIRL
jgi:hypothetical protein